MPHVAAWRSNPPKKQPGRMVMSTQLRRATTHRGGIVKHRYKSMLIAGICVLALGTARGASADLMITVGPTSAGDVENLLFNAPGLETGPALTVEGILQTTGTIFNIEGNELLLTPALGQARVEAEDGGFDWAAIYAADANTYFERFVANLQFAGTTTGTATITGWNQFGVSESFNFDFGPGENFFRITAINPQLIQRIEVQTTAEMIDIRQIRIGGLPGQDTGTIPEPATLMLFGLGLIGLTHRLSRRRG
jgi:hypothetical protein